MPDQAGLRDEARRLGKFILGYEPEPEFVERYVAAHEHLFKQPGPWSESALVATAVRWPILLPFLDAAAGLMRPASLLHRKALLMAAILEASPRHADEFLPRPVGVAGLMWILLRTGVVSAVLVAIGVPLLLVLGRRR